jgi:hypothetical protein
MERNEGEEGGREAVRKRMERKGVRGSVKIALKTYELHFRNLLENH